MTTQDQNKKTLRHFQCRDYLWEIFEQMSTELECSTDYLINEAMRQYARSRNYGTSRNSGQGETGANAHAAPGEGTHPSLPQQPASMPAPPMASPGGIPSLRENAVTGRPTIPSPPPPKPRTSFAGAAPAREYPPASHALSQATPVTPAPRMPPPQAPHMPPAPPAHKRSSLPPPPPSRSMQGHPAATGSMQRVAERVAAQAAPPPLPPSGPGRASMPPAMPAPAARARQLFIVFNGQKIPVTKEEFVIGRGSKSADLAIKDGNISRRHAAVVLHNGAYYLKDLGSTNGVEYQGRRFDSKRIEEGDLFRICDYELRFTYQ